MAKETKKEFDDQAPSKRCINVMPFMKCEHLIIKDPSGDAKFACGLLEIANEPRSTDCKHSTVPQPPKPATE